MTLEKLLGAEKIGPVIQKMKIPDIQRAIEECEDNIYTILESELFDCGSASMNAADLKALRGILARLKNEIAYRERLEREKQLKLF